jgi:hypothetical protein
MPGVVRLEENTLPVVVLDILCDFIFCISSFASAAPIIYGMEVFSFCQLAVAACWGIRCIPFLGALLV